MNVKITALSTLIAATLAAPAFAAEDGAYKVADKPIKLDIHLHQKKFLSDT